MELTHIQPFLQAYALAISSILEAAVTVVDKDLKRVSGTGPFADSVGEHIAQGAFFQQVLQRGEPGVVSHIREEDVCGDCLRRDSCKELANVAYPIFLDDQVKGLLSIVAFTEHEKSRLLRDRHKLGEFLKYMSMLIESKISTERSCESLEQQIQEVIAGDQYLVTSPFVSTDPEIRRILNLVGKLSTSSSTVLISGESGTGKEVLAKVIHDHSPRRDKLMISVNCGAIPESLMESELFGYDEGAFTGARRSGHVGKFELADNSTVFLDEVSEIPYSSQVKLLRVLQEQVVERLGGKKPVPINVRVICATNKKLEELVEQKLFRQDLYYRLNVIPITMPPLRRRKSDIEPLVKYWLEYYNKLLHKNIKGIDEEVRRIFLKYSWPGNVRELRNVVEYLVNILDGTAIRAQDLPEQFFMTLEPESGMRTLAEMKKEYERQLLGRLLKKKPGGMDKERLAQQLGISRASLYRKLAEHNLQ